MKSKVALAVAIALAILAAVGVKAYLAQKQQQYVQSTRTYPVVAAARNIKKNQRISPDMVTFKDVPEEVVKIRRPVFKDQLKQILNRDPIRVNVKAGDVLYWAYFRDEAARIDPAATLAYGYRQITIPVDKVTGCAGRLLPGSTVDVLATLNLRTDPNSPIQPVTQTVLTNVQVVATDMNVRRPTDWTSARQRRDYGAYSTVTLRVLPRQANLLTWLMEKGKLQLVIRRPDDPTGLDPTKIDKITMDNLDAMIKKASQEKPEIIKVPPR